jgi:hypothetical protein
MFGQLPRWPPVVPGVPAALSVLDGPEVEPPDCVAAGVGVGDVDRRVVRRHLAGVLRGVVEHRGPRRGRGSDVLLAVHQQVGAPAVRDAVHLPLHRVELLLLEERRDVAVVGHQVGVDRSHVTGRDQPQRGVAGRGHHVVLATLHQVDRLVGGVEVLYRRLAPGGLLEGRHPVDALVGRPVLGVAGPGQDVDRPLAGADALLHRDVRGREALRPRRSTTATRACAAAERGRRDCRRDHHGRLRPPPRHADSSVVVVPWLPSPRVSAETAKQLCWSKPTTTGRPRIRSGSTTSASRFWTATTTRGPASRSTR